MAFARADRRDRVEMLTVLALATPMELFFSEVWLVYEYQRGFLPAFVPPGHVFLFTLGRGLARRPLAWPGQGLAQRQLRTQGHPRCRA